MYPQVSQAQKRAWEQHWQQDSVDKKNKRTSLRNNDCFEAQKRKQKHHSLVTLIRPSGKKKPKTTNSRNSVLHLFGMQATRNSELRKSKTQQQ